MAMWPRIVESRGSAFAILAARCLGAGVTFLVYLVFCFLSGNRLHKLAYGWFDAIEGMPSTDPRGRGIEDAADFLGVGPLISVLLALIAGWIVFLATYRRNWSVEFFLGSVLFVPFSAVTFANYVRHDVIFTRDAQAILNILLVASASSLLVLSEFHFKKLRSVLLFVLVRIIQGIFVFSFIGVPLWYTLSYVSWRLGAGELSDFEVMGKAIVAFGSLLSVLGLSWKSGLAGLEGGLPPASAFRTRFASAVSVVKARKSSRQD